MITASGGVLTAVRPTIGDRVLYRATLEHGVFLGADGHLGIVRFDGGQHPDRVELAELDVVPTSQHHA